MRIEMLAALFAAPLLMAPAMGASPAAPAGGLCAAGEPVVFSCKAGAKQIAVCGKPLQYRYGTAGKLDLVSPDASGAGKLAYANTMYSGGGETQIVFARAGYQYVVYSSMVRTGFTTTNDPAFESGVAVVKDGRTLSTRKCTDPYDAPVDLDLAAKLLPEGAFVDR